MNYNRGRIDLSSSIRAFVRDVSNLCVLIVFWNCISRQSDALRPACDGEWWLCIPDRWSQGLDGCFQDLL